MPIPLTLPVLSEAELIRRAQQGDAEAFGCLFEKHKTRVYALCLRMTRNTAEAEDLTQDAFLHVFRKLSAFRADSALSTWLYRVSVNTVLMHFRKKSLATVSVDQPGHDDNPMPREFPTTDCRLTSCVDRMALNRALGELPNGYRKIFLLHEVAGYEHREIANFLGCSVGNSKSQLHKARQRIRELLTPATPLQASQIGPEKAEVKPRPGRQRVRAGVIGLSSLTRPLPGGAIGGSRGWATAA
ncbi:MAG: sigma-70 family RNA polymerase sigma factor [Terriglobales bacterium]